jgi:predicted metal-dependent hydrolase
LANEAYVEAHQQLRESTAAYREYGMPDELAMALADSVVAACNLRQSKAARQHLNKALRMTVEVQIAVSLIYALPGVGLFLNNVGELARAVEIYALALRYPIVANSHWFEDVVGKHIAAAAVATLPPEVVAAAQERGRARDLWATAEELIEELERQNCRAH